MMLPGSNPAGDPAPVEPPEPAPAEPAALPSTSRSMSSSEPGVLPPPPPGNDGAGSAGRVEVVPPTPAAAALEHLVGEPGQNHRREDREQLPHQGAAQTGPADRREAPEPVDDLVLLVAEDVAGDGRAVLLVDRGQVGSTGEQVVVVLPEGLQDRPRTGGVAGVGLETTEQRRQHGRGGGTHLVRGGADLLRDLVGRQCAEDVVDR